MVKTLSVDLRLRVCGAISKGLSCHKRAARFDVSISGAIRWQAHTPNAIAATTSSRPATTKYDRKMVSMLSFNLKRRPHSLQFNLQERQ